MALSGTVLLIHGGSSEGLPPNRGDFLSILAAAASALFILRLEVHASCAGGRAINAVSLLVVSILSIPWLFAVNRSPFLAALQEVIAQCTQLVQHQAPQLFYLGIVVTGLASWLQTVAQRRVPATLASVIYALDPLWGCLFASLWLGESLGEQGLLGASVLLLAVVGQLLHQAHVSK
eukprot:TRINITY_DN76942_c0_g1_i1.p1 TRINITY_DN76942_c0_g1~~TRINITY_DN76942_c0_g1_i1.p1  ORF type:complete len:204 (+),score=25.36 TRINITY_DN76942_c0_g1_i1:84-614(+)